ncbi:MAG: GTP 3',8-cyclase MoaA [Chthoniobacterales bacterium]
MTDPFSTPTDALGRRVDYLRISVTDRCNERCLYCLPADFHDWLPREKVLTVPEILAVAEVAVQQGVRRFRVTGGEPTARKEIVEIVAALAALPGVEHVSMTTNATRLKDLAQPLREAGLSSLNISLDALNPQRYREITGGHLTSVLAGIDAALAAGFSVKLNTVLIRGRNDNEIPGLIDFAEARNVLIRFIELMPVSLTEMLDESNFLPIAEVRRSLGELIPIERSYGAGPAKYFRLAGRKAIVGFIGALTDLHFCERCNKMRLTCEGQLRPCLGNHQETDLVPALRPVIDRAWLTRLFLETLATKPAEHLFRENYQPGRVMTAIGG